MSEIYNELPEDVRELIETPPIPFDQLEPVDKLRNLYDLGGREGDGLRVDLLYQKMGETVLVHVKDERAEEEFEQTVPSDKATDALNHPFAYAGYTKAA